MRRSLTLLAAALLALALPTAVMAQQACTSSTCTVTLSSVSQVVDGCGNHATPGRMRLTLSRSDPSISREDFPTVTSIEINNDARARIRFADWEFRTPGTANNAWQDGQANYVSAVAGRLRDTIFEVRPKAGAHVWSNRNPNNPNNPNAGPGELVVHVLSLQRNSRVTTTGSAYFLFMGGKGCARVGLGGELLGANQ